MKDNGIIYEVHETTAKVVECENKNDKKLKIINIPSKVDGKPVTEIGNSAFEGCNFLSSVVIPDSVIKIGNSAFNYCELLASVVMPSSIIEIEEWTFACCTSLKSIAIPNSVTRIGEYAFFGCKSLMSVTIPDSVREIDGWAFAECESLESVSIPCFIKISKEVGFDSIFASCKNINHVQFSQKLVDRPDADDIFNQLFKAGLRTREVLLRIPTL